MIGALSAKTLGGSKATPIGGGYGMANDSITAPAAEIYLQATRVYAMAAICLGVGLAVGYLMRTAMADPASTVPVAKAAVTSPHSGAMTPAGHMPSLAEMHQIASQKAAPLLAKLKKDPNNSALLMQIGSLYHSAHQFKDAATYYGMAVQLDPKNVDAHVKLAISLFRAGDVDPAIAELNRALSLDPKNPNALFNLGLIRLQGKQDPKGAQAAWQKLLKLNPQLDPERKAQVQKLMDGVMAASSGPNGGKGAGANE
jgi:cytochrome c-type biogenesis protein CcmH/NrfG